MSTKDYIDKISTTGSLEGGWTNLTGCNTCINSNVCDHVGNCILLSINQLMPDYSKSKRKLITKIRTYGSGDPNQIKKYLEFAEKKSQIDKPNRITRFERMCIKSLNKPR